MSQIPTPTNKPSETCSIYNSEIPAGPLGSPAAAHEIANSEPPPSAGQYAVWIDGVHVTDIECVTIPDVSGGTSLCAKVVYPFYQAMVQAANRDGVPLGNNSGFRTYASQERLYNKYITWRDWENSDQTTPRPPEANLAAKPGYSNHQNGIAFDLNCHARVSQSTYRTFEKEQADRYDTVYDWLVKNAWKYGFIRAVKRERWHWEYWGDWNGGELKPASGFDWHRPKSNMFAIVPEQHQVTVSRRNRWPFRREVRSWFSDQTSATHPDTVSNGVCNTWVGVSGHHVPSFYDRYDPGWRTREEDTTIG